MHCRRYSPHEHYYRLGPFHKCLNVRVRETGDWDLIPWDGRGQRLVELTEGCYSGGDFQVLQGSIKQPPRPWDTQYHYSINTPHITIQ